MVSLLQYLNEKLNTLIAMDLVGEKDLKDLVIIQEDTIVIMDDFSGQEMHTQETKFNNEKGQSAIEFILTFAFAIGVTFLFVNQALNMTEGYLVHYVNFMSSRAYLVQESGVSAQGTNLNTAKEVATEVFESYPLKDFGVNASLKINEPGIDGVSSLFAGTIVQFEKRLSSIAFVGGGDTAKFYSESFLGKEPTRVQCYRMICAAMTGSGDICESRESNTDLVLYDNGC